MAEQGWPGADVGVAAQPLEHHRCAPTSVCVVEAVVIQPAPEAPCCATSAMPSTAAR